jgi:multidrug efflux pump subunit AcrA (membrane-fusion protein)
MQALIAITLLSTVGAPPAYPAQQPPATQSATANVTPAAAPSPVAPAQVSPPQAPPKQPQFAPPRGAAPPPRPAPQPLDPAVTARANTAAGSYVAPASNTQPIAPEMPLGTAQATPDGRQLQITHCLVSLIEDIQAPALEAGALTSVEVTEGQFVAAGQLIAKVDDRQPALERRAAQLERDAAVAKAQDDIEVRYAKAALDVASADLERALAIERRNAGAVTPQEIQKLRLAKRRDELQIDRSKLELHVAQMNADVHQAAVEAAEEAMARRRIVSPIDGMVVTLFHERGEWVNAGEPVAQIVRIDRLRVEGFVNASDYSPADLADRPVVVEVPLAKHKHVQFHGQVVYISPLVQAGNKYRVRAEVENLSVKGHPLLRPGMTATMTISLP